MAQHVALHTKLRGTGGKDVYLTPAWVWGAIRHLLPEDKVAWEAFPGPGYSLRQMKELKYNVTGFEGEDFFEHDRGDYVLSNPPFSMKNEIVKRLYELDKPFMLLLPIQCIPLLCFRKQWEAGDIQLVLFGDRVHYLEPDESKTAGCPFDSVFICYKMNLPEQLNYIPHGKVKSPRKRTKLVAEEGGDRKKKQKRG